MKNRQVHLKIIGKVQGVWFRSSMKAEADKLDLTGWVRNCEDGSVEATVCGPDSRIETIISWARHGSANARVHAVEVTEQQPRQHPGFKIVN